MCWSSTQGTKDQEWTETGAVQRNRDPGDTPTAAGADTVGGAPHQAQGTGTGETTRVLHPCSAPPQDQARLGDYAGDEYHWTFL